MTHVLPEEHSSGTSFSWLHVRSKMWGLIHPDEKEDVGRKKKDGDRNGVKGEREVAPPRQLKAMRGTAVGSFLFGYVNPHTPPHTHTRTSLFNCSVKRPESSWVGWWWRVIMVTPRWHPTAHLTIWIFLLCSSASITTTTLHSSMATAGVPHSQMASWPICLEPRVGALHREDALGVWTVEARGEREERVVFWHRILRPFYFFSPSFLWFYGLLTGSRLSSGYERGSLADLLQRFWQGLQEERELQQGSCAGPDDPGGLASSWGNLTPLGGPLWCEPGCAKTTVGQIAWGQNMISEYFKTGCKHATMAWSK